MKPAIIVDLDGTLSDSRERKKLIDVPRGVKKDWDAFYEQAKNDRPNQWCLSLVIAMHSTGHEIIFVTGRPEKYRADTVKWLNDNVGIPFRLLMRPAADFRQDAFLKKEIYHAHIMPFCEVVLAIDDRKRIVDMWRSLGIPALHCDDFFD